MLSCECWADGEWWYYPPKDFTQFNRTRRKRCASCRELIDIGAECVEFECARVPLNEIEERIEGETIRLAPKYLCERCGEMYFNFDELGYCYNFGDSIQEMLEEYWDMTGFKPQKEE